MLNHLALAPCDTCGLPATGRLIGPNGDVWTGCSLAHAVAAAESEGLTVAAIDVEQGDLLSLLSLLAFAESEQADLLN